MAFVVEDYYDLLRLLREHPEWQAELRQVLLPEDFRSLPEAVRQLVAAQERTEETLRRFEQHAVERFGRLEEAVARLAEAQQRTEAELVRFEQQTVERFGRLEEAVARLAEAQQRTEAELVRFEQQTVERFGRLEEAVARLAEAQQRTEAELVRFEQQTGERFGRLEEGVARLEQAMSDLLRSQVRTDAQIAAMRTDIAKDRGITLEWRLREKAPAYFGHMLRRARAVPTADLDDMLEAVLPESERMDAMLLDLVVRGRLKGPGETPEVLLAVEVSATVDEGDVNRAARRATLLRRAGFSAIPVVAGEGLAKVGELEAEVRRVAILQDGRTQMWEEAVAAWPPLTQEP